MKKLIIIPAYNEGKNILKLIEDIKKNASDYDYIIIDDGSLDDTKKVCKENNLNYVSLPQNLGIGGAMQTGYKYAKENEYDVAIQIDGDGQHDISYLDSLVEKLNEGCDICIGSRYINKEGFQSSFMRRLGKNILSIWLKILTGKKITDPTSGFRACSKRVIDVFARNYPYDYPEPETIVKLLNNGFKVIEVPVIMRERQEGKSSITPIKSIKYMVKVIISMTFAKLEGKERV